MYSRVFIHKMCILPFFTFTATQLSVCETFVSFFLFVFTSQPKYLSILSSRFHSLSPPHSLLLCFSSDSGSHLMAISPPWYNKFQWDKADIFASNISFWRNWAKKDVSVLWNMVLWGNIFAILALYFCCDSCS